MSSTRNSQWYGESMTEVMGKIEARLTAIEEYLQEERDLRAKYPVVEDAYQRLQVAKQLVR